MAIGLSITCYITGRDHWVKGWIGFFGSNGKPSSYINESHKDKSGSGEDAVAAADAATNNDIDFFIRIVAWVNTTGRALSFISAHLPRLCILHLSFFHYTLMHMPAVISLCMLTNLEELTIEYAANCDSSVVNAEHGLVDFIALQSAISKL
jgi:hypothetical protein